MGKATTSRGRRRGSRTKKKGGMLPWYLAAVLTVGGVVAYDHRGQLQDLPGFSDVFASTPKSTSTSRSDDRPKAQARVATPPATHRTKPVDGPIPAVNVGLAAPTPIERPVAQPVALQPSANQFYFCGTRNDNCVVDGATFRYQGETIRVADVDAPRIKQASCDSERARGFYAKQRLRELLNAGNFRLIDAIGRDDDKTSEKLRVVMRHGRSLGSVLVSEGLVRPWKGKLTPWC
ncbi:thermonuclease family protein [Ensifer canadensis]